jgi:CHAT domain-containing protein
MRKGGGILLFLTLLAFPSVAERPPTSGGLPQLKRDISAIIGNLLLCYEQGQEQRFLEMAMHFAEIKTHPLFELEWGRHARNAAAERQMLLRYRRFRENFPAGSCPPEESERRLCRLAQEYIQANDHPATDAMSALDLPESCGLDPLQRKLSPSQLLLKYVMLDDRVLLFFVSSSQAGFEFLPVGRAQVVAMVQQLCAPLEDFANGQVDYLRIHFDMELAQRLYNLLLKRVAGRFANVDEFLVIPDEDLYLLPFDALVMGFNGVLGRDDTLFSEYQAADYVMQSYKVSYFFSFADFLRRVQARPEHAYDLVAFGYPLMPSPGWKAGVPASRRMDTISEIPSTRVEVLSLDKLFSGLRRRIFLGRDFNSKNFARYAPQARLIHLATHFFYNEKDPEHSAFLFSAQDGEPSFWDARQILDLRLNAELVILSACETSEKDLLGFKLVSGMTAALRRSGARGLIASLWPVDELNSQLVPLFYREFLKGGDSSSALRVAKLDLFGKTIALDGGVRLSMAHPFLWANYVLYRFCR